VDEAGTSAYEPVTVVVGIIANADEHVMTAEALANETLGAVPEQFKDKFVFHAMQVFGDSKYQDASWGLTDRLELLKAVMRIPRRVGMAVTVAAQWRGSVDHTYGLGNIPGFTPAKSDHLMAFQLCLAVADRNIRKRAGVSEVATVVAEDVPEMKRHLSLVPRLLRENSWVIPQNQMRPTGSDLEAGFITQIGDVSVTRIRNSVHFVEKAEDPMVQVADACAFGFRRFFAGQKFGVDFVEAILGDTDMVRNFASPGGCECYWPS
jgi:Protein of unknown function (DUF3800)